MMSWLARQDGYDPNAFDVPGEQTYDRRLDQTWPGQLAQDAIGAVLAPGRALQSTEPITTEQMIKPAADLAGLVTGGSYAAPAQKGASGAGIRAYHSSPHDFDKFDLSKIGTGEGAQVYGHGLYFAENPAVSGQGGQYWNQFSNRFTGPEGTAATYLRAAGFDREKAADLMRKSVSSLEQDMTKLSGSELSDYRALHGDRLKTLKLLESGQPIGPRTYEVNINADPAHMLDWDKPLREQAIADRLPSKLVEEAKAEAYNRALGATHQARSDQLWGMVKDPLQAPGEFLIRSAKSGRTPETSALLNEAGIPGIKYLDQGSRVGPVTGQKISQIEGSLQQARADLAGGFGDPERMARKIANLEHELSRHKPTSNYVIFDPNLIRIDKKYAVPGAIGAGGMGALAAQNKYEEVY